MLDLAAHRAYAWSSWHVFAYASVVYLLAVVFIVHHGAALQCGLNELFVAALLGATAVAGLGYQEVREAGGFEHTPS